MPIQLLMPALSPTMTEGSIAKWHKKEGDEVKAGEVLAEIETDKATMEFEAVDEGTLGRILVPEGAQGVKVNQPIALLLEEGEDASALAQAKPAPGASPAAPAAPKPAAAASQPAPAAPAPKPAAPAQVAPPSPAPAPAATNGHSSGARIFASPLARRIAAEGKLDLSRVNGTGPHGRIVKHDVEAALKGGAPRTAAAPAPQARAPAMPMPMPSPGAGGAPRYSKDQVAALAGNAPYTEHPVTGMRRVIATRLSESEAVPHYFLTVDCEIDALLKIRADINDALGVKTSVNDFVIKAAALALRKVPAVNAAWSEDAILQWQDVHVAVAVALPEGLITPIIKHADKKAIPLISSEMRELAERAKDGKLKLEEFQGGTISISNLGMFGTRQFTAVINPPQSAIIAVGAGEKRPVVKEGALAIATVMSCTATFDHRVVDGAVGAQFMAAFKKLIEAPGALLI
ncbi:MAG TPA: pyruvate dehydrogenase complex dihydrolipoamide acetyltransferase [Stellaceae bacterium]|jgi:pyruvate dehydrogenase E2 component (dihydrolipoamide acetyltransferase)|nr:pyruvate dehydrogenase complex dihydrolipoamide acetyltransferase [Stellaceae bacterium]